MYLNRKIDKWLQDWKTKEDKLPALIVGIRQCGKTESVINFGKTFYKNMLYINFWNNPEYKKDFDGSLDINTLISNLNLRNPNVKINPKETLIFFDEIQECPRARLAFKNFKIDGRYDVIGSGSYLGINGYIVGDSTPAPTGYDEIYNMHTMDFEEFLWANGYTNEQINILEKYFNERKQVPEQIHNIFKDLFLKYACVGGFPKAVKEFVTTKNIVNSSKIVQSIVFDMKSDFGRRISKNGEPIFKPNEISRIQNVFELIPYFLSKENKRFVVSKIVTGKSDDKNDAINYLTQAHVIGKVYNLEIPSSPLLGHIKPSQFKLFPEDIGIINSLYGFETIQQIYRGNLGQGKGEIYESLVYDALNKANVPTYYFSKDTGLEVDFVINYDGDVYLIECKAKNGNIKSSKTIMKNPDHYGKVKVLKIGDYNVGYENDILTIPHYMMFLLGRIKEF